MASITPYLNIETFFALFVICMIVCNLAAALLNQLFGDGDY